MFRSPFGNKGNRHLEDELNISRGETNLFANLWKPCLALLGFALIMMNQVTKPGVPDPIVFRTTTTWDFNLTEAANGRGPGTSRADVDTWVARADDSGTLKDVVGFRDKKTSMFILDQDDTGNKTDDPSLQHLVREEVVRTPLARLPEGLYIVNVHLYNSNGENPTPEHPIKVHVQVVINQAIKGHTGKVLQKDVLLTHDGQEVTAFIFKVDANGNYVPNSESQTHDVTIVNNQSYGQGG